MRKLAEWMKVPAIEWITFLANFLLCERVGKEVGALGANRNYAGDRPTQSSQKHG